MSDTIDIERQIRKIESEIDLLHTIEVPNLGTGGTFVEGPDIDLVIAAGSVTIGRAGDSILLFHANGNPMSEFAATEAGLIAALAAAAAGDAIELPDIIIAVTAPVTLPDDISLTGYSNVSSGLRAIVDVGEHLLKSGNGCTIKNLSIAYTGANSVNARYGLWGTGTVAKRTYVINCTSTCYNASSGRVNGIRLDGYSEAMGCWGFARGVGATAIGIETATGGFPTATQCAGKTDGANAGGINIGIYCDTVGIINGCSGSAEDGPVNIGIELVGMVDARHVTISSIGTAVDNTAYGFVVAAGDGYISGGYATGATFDLRIPVGGTAHLYALRYSTNSVNGTVVYDQGDRAAYSVEDYHAADIEAAALTRHLPAPVAIGDMAIVNAASKWAILTDVAAGQPFLSGGVATIPKYAGWTLAATAGQTYTFPAAGGTVALLNAANSFTLINPLTTIAESWIGPSATTGIYFKDGKIGIGTIPPAPLYLFHVRAADGISDNSYVAYISNEEATVNRNNGLWINAGSSASDYNVRGASIAGAALWSVTGAGKLSYVEADWTGGNVIYVPLTGDIQTYINAAAAGDTLILASGEYVITSTITVNKQINIMGQGNAGFYTIPAAAAHGTIISSVTGAVTCFHITSSNVRIAHLSINLTGAASTGIDTTNNLTGIVLTNIDVVVTCTGQAQGFMVWGSNAVLRDLSFYITSTNASCSGLYVFNTNATTQNAVVDCFTVTGVTKGTLGDNWSYICENNNDANTITLNMSNSVCRALAGTALDVAVGAISATTNNAIINCYQCTLDGQDYDAYQEGDGGNNQLNIGGSVLVNNLVFGIVTYRAAMSAGLGIFSSTTALQLKVGYDASNYFTANVSAAGVTTFATLPVNAGFVFTPPVTFSDNVTLTDDKWIGLGAANARLVFDITAIPDTAVFSSCNVGVGIIPTSALTVGAAGKVEVYRADDARSSKFYTDNTGGWIESSSTGSDPMIVSSPGAAGSVRFYVAGSEWARIDKDGITTILATTDSTTTTTGSLQTAGGFGCAKRIVVGAGYGVGVGVSPSFPFHAKVSADGWMTRCDFNAQDVAGFYLDADVGAYAIVEAFNGATYGYYKHNSIEYNGIKILGLQGAAVADATDAASVILRLNELLARVRAHGLIAT